ncbi:hypothetical protein ACFL42_02050 [Candidatus Omnitrophota bacterium]
MAPKKRSIGVTIFGVLLVLAAVFIVINSTLTFLTLLEGEFYIEDIIAEDFIVVPIEIAALVILAVGIFKLKNWARIICLSLAWVGGLSFLFMGLSFGVALSSEPDNVVMSKVILSAAAILGPVIFFLTRPEVKDQFRGGPNEKVSSMQ